VRGPGGCHEPRLQWSRGPAIRSCGMSPPTIEQQLASYLDHGRPNYVRGGRYGRAEGAVSGVTGTGRRRCTSCPCARIGGPLRNFTKVSCALLEAAAQGLYSMFAISTSNSIG
jgi:hypothetical protein